MKRGFLYASDQRHHHHLLLLPFKRMSLAGVYRRSALAPVRMDGSGSPGWGTISN
jgi:hypothetical protein